MKIRFFVSLVPCALGATLLTPLALPVMAQTTSSIISPAAPATSAPATISATPTEQDANALARYQLALDQLATGATGTARVILEDSVRRYGPRPEINLLLAYILQREGNNIGALNAANQVAPTSTLASAFSNQLRGAAPANANNAAVSPYNSQNNGQNSVSSGSLAVGTVPAMATVTNSALLAQNDARLTKLELAMMEMVNAERAKERLNALQWNDDLSAVARAHSAEMRDKNYFSHESPTPGIITHLDRYRAAGHEAPRVIAENIFRAWGSPKQVSLGDVQAGHDALMQSPGHRANILFRDVTQIGIGIATNAKGDIWITQMFLRP